MTTQETKKKDWDAMHPLVGPTCPEPCNTPFRRRRFWERWNTAFCPKCDRRAECVSTRPLAFIFVRVGGVR